MAKGGLQEKEAQALSLCSGVDAAELDLRLPEPRRDRSSRNPHGSLSDFAKALPATRRPAIGARGTCPTAQAEAQPAKRVVSIVVGGAACGI